MISVVPPSTELFTTLKKMVPGMSALELGVWGWEEMAGLGRSPGWALCALRGREHCTKGHRPDPFYLLPCPQGTPFQRIFSLSAHQQTQEGARDKMDLRLWGLHGDTRQRMRRHGSQVMQRGSAKATEESRGGRSLILGSPRNNCCVTRLPASPIGSADDIA